MSRTYRRKNGWDNPTYDFIYSEEGYVVRQLYDKKSKEYKIAQVKYHQDGNPFRGSVPHWFVNLFCERSLRRTTKHEIHKWMKNPETIEPMIPEFIRDAGWKYW